KDRMNVASASIRKGIISSIIRKDLLVEYRSKQTFISTLFFGLLVLVVGNFALTSTGGDIAVYAPGILWIAFFFSGQIFLSHALLSEKEENTIAGLIVSPASPGEIFLGKMFSAVIFLVTLEFILLPVFHILFNYNFSVNTLWLCLILILTSVGYCALGVLFSTMSMGLRNHEILLSVILFPILLPLLIMAVKASIILLTGTGMESFGVWLRMIIVFDAIFVVLSFWAYFWVLEA